MKTRLAALLLAGLLAGTLSAQTPIYVNQNAPASGANNGASWVNAYHELRDALNDPKVFNATATAPATIWLARGTYKPTAGTDRTASFVLQSHLRIVGGFAGGETSLPAPNLANLPVLSGDIGQPQAHPVTPANFTAPPPLDPTDAGYLDNSYNVVTGAKVQDVLLQFVLVTGGNANGANILGDELELETMTVPEPIQPGPAQATVRALETEDVGGGMYLSGGDFPVTNAPLSLVLSYCYFVNNTALGYGGGMALVNAFGIALDSIFQNNAAPIGGAAWMWSSQFDFDHCSFTGNVANGFNLNGDAGFGGALAIQSPASYETVASNTLAPLVSGPIGAAIDEINYEAFVLPRFTIQNPGASELQEEMQWGADRSQTPLVQTTPFKLNSNLAPTVTLDPTATLSGNWEDSRLPHQYWYQNFVQRAEAHSTASFLPFVGEQYSETPPQVLKQMETFLYNTRDLSILVYCQFSSNSAAAGGGAVDLTDENIYAEDCTFSANQSDDGGAIYSSDFSVPQIVSCVFETNAAVRGFSAIDNARHSWAQIVNSTFVGNTSVSPIGYAIGNQKGTEAHISNCILWGNTNGSAPFAHGGADIYTATGAELTQNDPPTAAQYNSAGDGYPDFVALCDLRGSIVQGLGSIVEGSDDIDIFGGIVTTPPSILGAIVGELAEVDEGGLVAAAGAKAGAGTIQETDADVNSGEFVRPAYAAAMENAGDNLDLAEITGQLQSYGLYNAGQGFRPGTLTARGNTNADPKLVDGFRLSAASPAIGMGDPDLIDNTAISSYTTQDVLGQPRFTTVVVGTNVEERLDIGAAQYMTNTPVIVYVNQNATGENTGQSWRDALTNLQQALLMTNAEVWVAAGTYVPSAANGGTFTLTNGVQVYGGFTGLETSRSQRDFQAYQTILSGNMDAENSVLTCANLSSNTALDGFRITAGHANDGGGIFCTASQLTIRNCLFQNNEADGAGGGLFCQYGAGASGPIVANCQFLNNAADTGGGAAASDGPLTLENDVFKYNQAGTGGGVSTFYASVTVIGGLFVSNTVSLAYGGQPAPAGAAFYADGANVEALVNCTMADNQGVSAPSESEVGSGGAVDINTAASAQIINCILWGNTVSEAGSSAEGAQLSVTVAAFLDTTIANCIVQGLGAKDLTGNFGADPRFNNPAQGGFSLNAYSPAIDSGQFPSAAYSAPYDVAGDPRIMGLAPDIGAYEFAGVPKSFATVLVDQVDCGAPPGQNPTQVLSLLENGGYTSYQWLVDREDGNGLVVLTDDANHYGSGSASLIVTNPPLAMNGWQYELTAQPDFISEVYTLQVTPGVVYVNAAATGAGNGVDWADAYTNLQDAIDDAAPCTELWVAAGTYRPAGLEATNAFHLRPGARIYGGFAGDETNLAQRAWQTNVTVLSGNWQPLGINLQNNDVFLNDGSEPGTVIDTNAILDGFTIMGSLGPLLENKQASPTLENCVLISPEGVPPLQNIGGSAPALTNCVFATIPAPLCDLGAGGTFAVSNYNGAAAQFTWEVNSGFGFGLVANNPAYNGFYQLNDGAGFSDLTLLTIPPADVTDQFIFTNETGYVSPDIGLSVGNPPIVFVNAAATGLNNGTSWANAYKDLQSAISADSGCVEIWVAKGTYAPNVSIGNSFALRSQAAVYGGFAGNEIVRSQRNWLANPTLLTGRPQNDVVNDNTPMNASAVLDGFVFSHQTAAIVINNTSGASPTIQNCAFIGNAGISIYNNNSSPQIFDCSFTSNRAAAIYVIDATINVSSCAFTNNTNTLPGGAIYVESATVNVSGSQFIGNQAQSGGAAYLENGATLTANESIFQGNGAGTGGAVFVSSQGNLAATNCLFDNNASQFEGGAISHFGNQLTLAQCTIVDNTAFLQGGGAYLGGQSATIQNSIFWHNSLTYAGDASVVVAAEEAQLDGNAGSLSTGALTLDSCTVQDLQTNGAGLLLYLGANCTAFDPLFANSAAGNYQLTAASPALGAANSLVNSGVSDLAGNPRVVSGRLDEGAYEFQGAAAATLSLLTQPVSQSVCSGTTTSFAIAGATNANYNYQWEYNNGLGFIPAEEGGFAVTTVSNTSTLTINSATSAINGWQFEVSIGGYTAPPVTLTVIEPTVLYVEPGGQGDGSSWSSPMGSIPDAVAAANGCTAVWVAGGTYTLTNASGQAISLQMKDGVQILGGFAGTETSDTQRDWNANPTVLQPGPGAAGSLPALVENDGSVAPVSRAAILDGFVLANGNNGIVNNAADPTIRNCVFTNFVGYAIFNSYRASPLLENCAFRNNLNTAIESFSSVVVASNCLFEANAATKSGGAIDNEGGSMVIADSQFTGNSSTSAGGALYGLFCDTVVSRCLFAGNSAEFGGGLSSQNGTLAMDDSLFNANSSSAGGGALDLESATNYIVNCTLYGNTSPRGAGGGVYQVGGSVQMANSILWLNTAGYSSNAETAQIWQPPNSGGTVQVSYSCLQGLSAFAGNHNSADDPVFQNAPVGNFELDGYSPLLDSGNVTLATNSVTDLAGQPRVNFSNAVDPGAYENENPPQGSLQVALLPTSQNVCEGSDAIFAIQTPPGGSTNYLWFHQFDNGYNPGTDPTEVIVTNGAVELVIHNVTPQMSGWTFNFDDLESGYASPSYMLTVAEPGIIYVNAANASASQNGSSWAAAFTNLESAFDAAAPCSQIWVAEGTYVPDPRSSLDAFSLRAGVGVYGGFSGSETSLEQRDWTNNATRVVGSAYQAAFYNDPALFAVDNSAVLDGFTVTGSNGNPAMLNFETALRVNHCTFTSNSVAAVENNAASPSFAGCLFVNNSQDAVDNLAESAAVFTNCAFVGNGSHGMYNSQSSPLVENCSFVSNFDGAISEIDANSEFLNCIMSNNFAVEGGAYSSSGSSTSSLLDCLMVNNKALVGGAAALGGGSQAMINCTLFGNQASEQGGGVVITRGAADIFNSILWNNGDSKGAGLTAQIDALGGADVVSNSLVAGWSSGNADMAYDPLFVDAYGGNFQLMNASPALSLGNTNYAANISTDLAGAPRNTPGAGVDAGVYQGQSRAGQAFDVSQGPVAQYACLGGTAIYTVTTVSAVTGFLWQYNTGNGWTDFSVDGSGVGSGPSLGAYNIASTADSSTLTVSSLDPAMNGYEFRVELAGAVEPYTEPAPLYVNALGAIYVNAQASPGGDGNSWATAFNDIDAAVADVACRREIWVVAGTYVPAATIVLPEGTLIYGGFAGTETSLSQRNSTANKVFLDGSNLGAEPLFSISGNDPATNNHTVLDGVTVRNASTGAFVEDSSPTFTNCVFYGDALALSLSASDALVAHCQFYSNLDNAISLFISGSPRIQYSIIAGNFGQENGAAVSLTGDASSNPQMLYCLLTGNEDGAINVASVNSLTVVNCTIADNASGSRGAGIDNSAAAMVFATNCIIWNNSSPNSYSQQDAQFYSFTPGLVQIWDSTVEELINIQNDPNQNNNSDPLFYEELAPGAAPVYGGNYHLQPCSPAIASGFYLGLSTDLDGNPVSGFVDGGAYQSQSAGGPPLVLYSQPAPATNCVSPEIQFTVDVDYGNTNYNGLINPPAGLTYQWQRNANDGRGFVNVTGSSNFIGSQTLSLSVVSPPPSFNQSQLRCVVTTSAGCTEVSEDAILTVQPTQWFVNAAAAPGGNGASWSNAFNTLEAALTNPSLSPCGTNQIWVAGGIYTPAVTLPMATGIGLYGGFSGNETVLSQRNWAAHPSIVRGNGASEFFSATGSTAMTLDGFVLENGGTAITLSDGAAPTIANCVFQTNTTPLNLLGGSPLVQNCRFLWNGGQINVVSPSGFAAPNFENCWFQGNLNGVIQELGSQVTMNNCLLSGNVASGLTGVVNATAGFLNMANCTVAGNQGVGCVMADGATPNIYNSIFWSNSIDGQFTQNEQITNIDNPVEIGGIFTCDIQDARANASGERLFDISDFSADPQFLAPLSPADAPTTNGNFALSPCSPLINAGANVAAPASGIDLAGNPRIYGGTVDLGAFELQAATLQLVSQNAQPGSFVTPARFSVTATPVTGEGLAYQWFGPNGAIAGATNSILTVSNLTPAFNGGQYYCQISSDGCQILSEAAALQYVNVIASGAAPGIGSGATLSNSFRFSFGPNLDSDSVSAQSVVEQGFESGVSPASLSVSGNTVTLGSMAPHFPGEEVEVSATGALESQSGLDAQPFVWDFRAPVPNSNSMQLFGESLTNSAFSDVAVGDFNHDGWLDLLLAGPGGAQIWTNNGAGALAPAQVLTASAVVSVRAGDLNGDGWLDAALVGADGTVSLWTNAQGVLVSTAQSIGSGGESVALGDLNGDGSLDLFVVGSNPAQVWFNNGAGAFSDSGQHLGVGGASIALGDVNADGALDAVIAGNPGQTNEIWFNDARGNFSLGPQTLGVAPAGGRIALGDLNGDGRLDALTTESNGVVQVWLNNGGGFAQGGAISVSASGISLAEFEANGNFDLCVAQTNGQFSLWRNDGAGSFALSGIITHALGALSPAGAAAVAAGDFDHNGALSLIAVGSGGATLLRNVNFDGQASAPLAVPPVAFSDSFGAFSAEPLSSVTFLSLPAIGTLQINGSPIAANTEYDVASLDGLEYAPPSLYLGGTPGFIWRGATSDGDTVETNAMTLGLANVAYAPIAANDTMDVVRDQSTNGLVGGATSVLADDSDPNGGTLTASLLSPPAHGSLTLNPDGTFLYTQDNSENSSDSFTYLLTSSEGATNVGTVFISINLHTTRPIATNQDLIAPANTSIDLTLTGSDPNGDSFQFAISNNPAHGTLSGTLPDVTYTPDAGFFGTDAFTFYTYDDLSNSAAAIVSILVNPLPVASNLFLTVTNVGPLPITLAGSDALNYPLTFTILRTPTNGVLTGSSSNWVYQQNFNYSGPDGFTFAVNDSYGDAGTGAVSILVQNTTLLVTNLADNGPGTLRSVINVANANAASGPWLIQFAPQLAGHTISLSTVGDSAFGDSALAAAANIVIAGETAPGLRLARSSTAPPMRLFRVATNASLILRDIALAGGLASGANGSDGNGGGGGGGGFGGAIFNQGALQLFAAVLLQNAAVGGNGGAGFDGVTGGTGGGPNGGAGGADLGANPSPGGTGGFDSGGGGGGGVFFGGEAGAGGFAGGAGGGAVLNAPDSAGGQGGFGGGGGGSPQNAGGGGAGLGGALFNDAGTVLISNSAFASNSAAGGSAATGGSYLGAKGNGYGGAIFNYNGTLTILNSACTNNTADDGGALYNVGDGSNSLVFETNVDYSNPASGQNEDGSRINGGSSSVVPQLDYVLACNTRESATLNLFSVGSSNQVIGVTQGASGTVAFDATSVTYTQVGPQDNNDAFAITITNGMGGSYVANVTVDVTVVHHPPMAGNIVVSAYRGYPITIDPLTNCFDQDGNPMTIVSYSYTPIGFITQTTTNFGYYENGSIATQDSFTYTITDGYNEATGNITVNFLPFVLIVTNTADSGPGTLRAAVNQANAPYSAFPQTDAFFAPLWTIQFDPSLAGQSIELSSVGDTNFGPSALMASGSMAIDATNAPGLSIARDPAAPPMRLLSVLPLGANGPFVVLRNLTMSNGLARGQDRTDGSANGQGGAVFVEGAPDDLGLTTYFLPTNVAFTGNEAIGAPAQGETSAGFGEGGAVYATNGYDDYENCYFWSNAAVGGALGQGFGGGLYLNAQRNGGSLVFSFCQITNNTADNGGGVYNLNDGFDENSVGIQYCTIAGNFGTDLVNVATGGNFNDTSVSGANSIASQTAPWLPTIPSLTLTNGGQVNFPATPNIDGATNYAVTYYAYDNTTFDQVTNGIALTNSGTNYTLSIEPESCRGDVLGVEISLFDGHLEYDSFFYVTNFVTARAAAEALATDKNTEITNINVLTNDCGTSLSIASFSTNGTLGQVTLNDDGTFTYDPAPLVNGVPTTVFPTLGQGKTSVDSFTYTIVDALGNTSTATVTITVQGVNDPPTPSNPLITRLPGTNEVVISVASLGGDPDGDLVTLASFSATSANGGTIILSGGNLIFTPHDDHSTDAFSYTLSDPYDATATGRVLITVDPLSTPGVIAIQPVADDFVCAFRAQTAQTYIIEESDSPAGPWTVVGPAIANSNGTYTFRDTDVSPTQRFFRIVTQ